MAADSIRGLAVVNASAITCGTSGIAAISDREVAADGGNDDSERTLGGVKADGGNGGKVADRFMMQLLRMS